MTRTLDPGFEELRRLALRMGGLAEAILDKALRALWQRDAALAGEVQRDDLEIDRLDVEIDDAILRLLALQAPVAQDLRHIVAIKMMATDLERVGDLARNIAKCARRWSEHAPFDAPPGLRKLADESARLLRIALDGFADADCEKARRVLAGEEQVDADHDALIRRAIVRIGEHPETTSQQIDLIQVAKHLERVADHATNIAEEAILVAEAQNVKHADKLAGAR